MLLGNLLKLRVHTFYLSLFALLLLTSLQHQAAEAETKARAEETNFFGENGSITTTTDDSFDVQCKKDLRSHCELDTTVNAKYKNHVNKCWDESALDEKEFENLISGAAEGTCAQIKETSDLKLAAINKNNKVIRYCEKTVNEFKNSCEKAIARCEKFKSKAVSQVVLPPEKDELEVVIGRINGFVANAKGEDGALSIAESAVKSRRDELLKAKSENTIKLVNDVGILKKVGCHISKHKAAYLVGGGVALLYFKDKKKKKKKKKEKNERELNAAINSRSQLLVDCTRSPHAGSNGCKREVERGCLENPGTAECESFAENYCGNSSNPRALGTLSSFCVERDLQIYCRVSGNSSAPGCVFYNSLAPSCKKGSFLEVENCKNNVESQAEFNTSCRSYPSDPYCRLAATDSSYTASPHLVSRKVAAESSGESGARSSSVKVMRASSASVVNRFSAVSGRTANRRPSSDVTSGYGTNVLFKSSQVVRKSCTNGKLLNCGF